MDNKKSTIYRTSILFVLLILVILFSLLIFLKKNTKQIEETNTNLVKNQANTSKDEFNQDITFEIPGLVGNTRKVARKHLGISPSGTYGLYRLGGDAYPTWKKEGCESLETKEKIDKCYEGFKSYEQYINEHGGPGLYYYKVGSMNSKKIEEIEFQLYDPIEAGWEIEGQEIWWINLQQNERMIQKLQTNI